MSYGTQVGTTFAGLAFRVGVSKWIVFNALFS